MAAALACGAALRRRERRLRSWLRHERQTVAMVLAEACHHSSGTLPRRPRRARRPAGTEDVQDSWCEPQGGGSARQRRERRLWAWHRHERMTVAIGLATALHHSAQRVEAPREGVEGVQNFAPPAQKPPLWGSGRVSRWSPRSIMEQSRSVTWLPQCRCWPARQARSWTSPPSNSSSITLWRCRRDIGGGGEEDGGAESGREAPRQVRAGEPLTAAEHEAWYGVSSSSAGKRRKKKRMKRKFPRASLPRCGRPCEHQRQVLQSKEFVLIVPQIQFISRVWGIPVVQQRQVPTVLGHGQCVVRWCRKLSLFRSCSSSTVVDIPFVPQRQILLVQTTQQTTEIPQLLFDFRWSLPLLCRSCWPCPLLSTTGAQAQTLQKTVDVPQLQFHRRLWTSL